MAKTEKRGFKDEENEEIASIQIRKAEIDESLSKLEDENRSKGEQHKPQVKEGFSLRRAIVNQMYHREQRESEMSVIEEAREQQRGVSPDAEGDLFIPLASG